jgi:tetratricopeptide (TPR) repeat protein
VGHIGAAVAALPEEGALGALVVCLARGSEELALLGRYADADAMLARARSLAGSPPVITDDALAVLHEARALRAIQAGDLVGGLIGFEAALTAFEQGGDRRNACTTRTNASYVRVELGDPGGAEVTLGAALADAERMGLREVVHLVKHNLGYALAHVGRLEEALRHEREALEGFRSLGNLRIEGLSQAYLARIALLSGDAVAAEREARAAAALLEVAPPLRACALALLARALLSQGRAGEALPPAEEAHAELQRAGTLEEGEALVRLVYAEALEAAGRLRDAGEARASARTWLLERAARISDPAWRERFLTQVPDHAAILATAPC